MSECPVCGRGAFVRLPVPSRTVGGSRWSAGSPPLGLVQCCECGFVFVSPRPDAAALSAFYAASDYTAHEPVDDAAAVRRAQLQLDAIAGWGGQLRDAALLDMGCGGGQFLALARDRGARPTGFDVGDHALAACRRAGIPATSDRAALVLGSYDGILMSHVFEHVADPRETLRWCYDLLRPGGWLCLEVPNVSSLRARLSPPALAARLRLDERYRAFPIHLSYFAPDTLARLLAGAGFCGAQFTTTGFGIDGLRVAAGTAPQAPPVIESSPRRTAPIAPSSTTAPASTSAGAQRSIAGRVRSAFKRAYFDHLFGENLIGFVRR